MFYTFIERVSIMAKPRIATKPAELRDQMQLAWTAIGNEANWPATAPTDMEVETAKNNINTSITAVEDLKSQLSQARATLHTRVDTGVDIMKRIDEVTDGLYGSDSPEKNNFGLPPKKSTHGEQIPLGQVVIIKIADGTAPASIFVDWDPDAGATAYQIEWFSDPAMTAMIGSAAVSSSDHEIQGLTQGQQYWIRVRSVRGNEYGQWSDPATRVANL
jgi:hypothetical protein